MKSYKVDAKRIEYICSTKERRSQLELKLNKLRGHGSRCASESEICALITNEGDGHYTIDASLLQELVFPLCECSVFISHAHEDTLEAKILAQAIEDRSQDAHCFIDSEVWGNVENIVETLQIRFAQREDGFLDNDKCNHIASACYLILSSALFRMIHDSSIFVFLTPKNSSCQSDQSSTRSSWIAQEIMYAQILHALKKSILLEKRATNMARSTQISIDFSHTLDVSFLKSWVEAYSWIETWQKKYLPNC